MVVDTAGTLSERDVIGLGDDALGIISASPEATFYFNCNLAGIAPFKEPAVGRAFTGSVLAVAIVDKDFHSNIRFNL